MGTNFSANVNDFLYKPDTFGTIRAMGIDKYPGEMPIVRELLQNADDAGSAKVIRFRISEREIVVENDGKPFSKPSEVKKKEDSDFYRISHIGLGKTEEGQTGTFGIGFTSVFHVTDNPRIVSNGWDFEIHVDDVPSIKEVSFNPITRLHLPLRLTETEFSKKIRAEPFDLKKLETFEKEIILEAYRDIFHLKTIKKIEVYKNDVRQFSISRKIKKTSQPQDYVSREQVRVRMEFNTDGQNKSRSEEWTIYSLSEIDIPSNLSNLRQTLKQKVAIAIPLNLEHKRITKKFDKENYAYYTLPIMQTGFNFRFNASKFYTTSGRSEFVTKEGLKFEWNLWQMDNLANLLICIIEDLVANNVDPRMLYQIVPTSSNAKNIFDERIFNAFKDRVATKKVPMFYVSGGIWRAKDGTFVNWDGLYKVLPEDSGYHFIDSKLSKCKAVFLSYGIQSIGTGDFVSYLERKYGTSPLENRQESTEVIHSIFEYFGKAKIDSPVIERLKKICILLTEEDILRSCEYGVYFPTDANMPLIDKDDVLNHQTYKTRLARKFLEKKLKIKRIDLHLLITDSFLRRTSAYSDDQKFEFMWYLIKHQRDVCRKRKTVDALKSKLREILVFKKNDNSSGSIFFDDSKLKRIFGSTLNYLDPRFEKQGEKDSVNYRNFLKKIGVEEYPNFQKILTAVRAIESTSLSWKNIVRVNVLLKFLETHWRRYYSKHSVEFTKLQGIKWMPTINRILDYPTNVYANKNLTNIIGKNQQTIAANPPKNKKLMRLLGLLTEPRLDDVVSSIVAVASEGKEGKNGTIPFAAYYFLDKRAELLTHEHIDALKKNKTIWLRNKLWKPSEIFLDDCTNDFGPSGWLRAYAVNARFSKLDRLCYKLEINKVPRSPDSYIDWLKDLADYSKNVVLEKWKSKLVYNAYTKLSLIVNSIPDEQLEKLRDKKVMLTSASLLKPPNECYLLRKGEGFVRNRMEKSGITVHLVEPENAEHEKLFLRLKVNELAYLFYGRRTDSNHARLDQELTNKLNAMTPWLDGFEFSSVGTISQNNLIFAKVKVYRVSGLQVIYAIRGLAGSKSGVPIEDLCCFEKNGENTLYLEENFDLRITNI